MISIKQGLASIQTNKPNKHACSLWLSVTIGAVFSFFFICLPKAHTQTHTEKRTKLNLNYEHRETKQRHVFVSLLATVAWDQEACVKPWSPEIQHKYADADTANSSCLECWQFSTSMCTVWQQVVSRRLKGIEVLIQKNDFHWVSIINVCVIMILFSDLFGEILWICTHKTALEWTWFVLPQMVRCCFVWMVEKMYQLILLFPPQR